MERVNYLNRKNQELQYHTAWSNECIEFWFLLHFAYYTSNNHRTEYIRFLNEKYEELGFGKYRKNMDETFDILMERGNPKLVAKYAKRIIKEHETYTPASIAPGTMVYKLVEELAKYLQDDQKSRFI